MKIVDINSKSKEYKEEVGEEVPGYLHIFYTDGTDELLQVDSFGIIDEMQDYLTLWRDSLGAPIAFIRQSSIKKIVPTLLKEVTMEEFEDNGNS